MTNQTKCLICLGNHFKAVYNNEQDRTICECNFCGNFNFLGKVEFGIISDILKDLIPSQRVSIAHEIKGLSKRVNSETLSQSKLMRMMKNSYIPPIAKQIKSLIINIARIQRVTNTSVHKLPDNFYILIGAPNVQITKKMLQILRDSHHISFSDDAGELYGAIDLELTLNGWENLDSSPTFGSLNKNESLVLKSIESIQKKQTNGQKETTTELSSNEGKVGFIAMQYGEKILENMVRDHIKPKIESELGFRVYAMRDVSKAGIIDNLMQTQIEKSEFVIADLTHDNSGAYWEAGFATAIGIPVIYICEKDKFEKVKTHFDTSHWTTVFWTHGNEPEFCKELIETIKNSLN